MCIVSKRLNFRKLTSADVSEKYVGWLNDPEVNRYLEVRHYKHTVENCREFVDSINQDQNAHFYGIFLNDNSEHIGNIKIGFVNRLYMSGQVSLLIGDRSQWGKGFATEAIDAITRHGFLDLQLERLEAGCYQDNLGSLRAFLKSGYVVEGFSRNSVTFDGRRSGCFWLGILKSEFDA